MRRFRVKSDKALREFGWGVFAPPVNFLTCGLSHFGFDRPALAHLHNDCASQWQAFWAFQGHVMCSSGAYPKSKQPGFTTGSVMERVISALSFYGQMTTFSHFLNTLFGDPPLSYLRCLWHRQVHQELPIFCWTGGYLSHPWTLCSEVHNIYLIKYS